MQVKEKIITLLNMMPEHDAEMLLQYITSQYQVSMKSEYWTNIEEVEPDEIDIIMLNEIKSNPDCSDFVSEKELKHELGII